MLSRLALLIPLLFGAVPASAQSSFPEAESMVRMRRDLVGQRVRHGNRAVGVVRSITQDTLILDQNGQRKAIPLEDIRRLEILSADDRRNATGAALGAVGAGAAAALGTASFVEGRAQIPIIGGAALLGAALASTGKRDDRVTTVDMSSYLAPQWDGRLQGRRVRVQRLGSPKPELLGRVVVISGDEMVVRDATGRMVAVHRSEIHEVEVYRYRPELSVIGVAGGAGLGFVGGFIVGGLAHPGSRSDVQYEQIDAFITGMLVGAVTGIVGGIAGFQLGNTWTSLPRSRIGDPPRVSLRPGGPGGVGLTASGTF